MITDPQSLAHAPLELDLCPGFSTQEYLPIRRMTTQFTGNVTTRAPHDVSFRASVASRGISACNGKSSLGMEIPRLPSVAALLSVTRNDGG